MPEYLIEKNLSFEDYDNLSEEDLPFWQQTGVTEFAIENK